MMTNAATWIKGLNLSYDCYIHIVTAQCTSLSKDEMGGQCLIIKVLNFLYENFSSISNLENIN